MSYARLGLTILASTAVMFVLMYLNTYSVAHLHFSETRLYMALMMGAAMAILMLASMWSMYRHAGLNLAILVAAAGAFALALWLVRSQVTVSGQSYMRAMIPHHSIAIMTSERADIRDPRVASLAAEIAEAQRREIAEMGYLLAAGADPAANVPAEPPARPGTLAEALGQTRIGRLDPSPLTAEEAAQVLAAAEDCGFRWAAGGVPILRTSAQGGAALKLNGVILALDPAPGGLRWTAAGVAVRIIPAMDGRPGAAMEFALDRGLSVGYLGLWSCAG